MRTYVLMLQACKRSVCSLLLAATASVAVGRDFFVAPNGSDSNPGTLEKPFATIARARDAVRPTIATMTGDITVWIRGGRYYLKEAIALDDRDGGTGTHRVIYRNYKDEKAIILGGTPVTGWAPYERGIMKADVGKDVEFWALLVDDKLATMAGQKAWYSRPPKSARNVQIYSQKSWMSEYLRVTSFDAKSRTVSLEFKRSDYAGKGTYMRGSYTFIDEPGEWALDSDSGTLYYYPRSPAELKNVVRPTTSAVFRIRGRTASQPARNILIEGVWLRLTDFLASMRCYANRDRTIGRARDGIDYPNTMRTALIAIEDAVNIHIRHCDLSEAPVNAISIYRLATDNTVYGCRMNNLGYMGVYLAGPWIQERAPNINCRHTIRNCLISNLTKGVNHPAGVAIYQSSDNKIQNNMIHTSRRYAISTKGIPPGRETTVGHEKVPSEKWYDYVHSNRNVISHNYIYDCVKDSADAGAIESWGGGRDIVVDHNIIFNAYGGPSSKGWRAHSIFFDNGSAHATITNNVVWSTRSPSANAALMLKGVKMLARNNVFDASTFSLGGIQNQGKQHQRIHKNVFYANCPLKVHDDGRVGPEKDGDRRMFFFTRGHSMMSSMDENLYYNAQGSPRFATGLVKKENINVAFDEWRKITQDKGGLDKNSRVADPQFVDAAARDYRLRETSPALDMGISSIDTSSIGLLQDFPFAPANDPLRAVFLKANNHDVYVEVQPGETVTLQVTGRTKGWYVADLSKAVIRYKVDDPEVATVSEEGKVTLRGKGRACITATVTLGGVTRSDDVVVYVGVPRGARP